MALVLVILLVACIGYGFYQYEKPRTTAADSRTSHRTDAISLYHEFMENETSAMSTYGNTIIEVSGVVYDIDSSSGNKAVLLSAGESGYINCSMMKLDRPLHKDEAVVVKGKCSGFMVDVLLVDCTLR